MPYDTGEQNIVILAKYLSAIGYDGKKRANRKKYIGNHSLKCKQNYCQIVMIVMLQFLNFNGAC